MAYQLARLAAVGDPVAAEAAAVPSWQELGQELVLPEPRQVAWQQQVPPRSCEGWEQLVVQLGQAWPQNVVVARFSDRLEFRSLYVPCDKRALCKLRATCSLFASSDTTGADIRCR